MCPRAPPNTGPPFQAPKLRASCSFLSGQPLFSIFDMIEMIDMICEQADAAPS